MAEDDDNGLHLKVTSEEQLDRIIIKFDKPVDRVTLTAKQAQTLAEWLKQHADRRLRAGAG